MRKGFLKHVLATFAVLFTGSQLLALNLPVNRASAGASKNYVLSGISVSGDSINLGDWLIDGGVYAKNSKIHFDKDVIKNTSYVTAATKINNLYECGLTDLFTAKMDVNINEIVNEDNGKIQFIFGMNSVRNISKAKDCLKIVFENNKDNKGIDLSIVEVNEEGEEKVVLNRALALLIEKGKEFPLYVSAKTDGDIDIKIDDTYILKNYRPNINLTGYFSIFSSGKNDFTLSKTELLAYTYIVSENVDYLETFDNGEYNSNIFYSSAIALDYTPSSLSVNEDGALEFLNTHEAYFSTKYAYSNYELEFDLFDLVVEDVRDENGNIVKPKTGRIGIGTGENYKGTIPEFEHNDKWLLLWGDRPSGPVFEFLDRFEMRKLISMSKFDLWDKDFIKDRKVNVKYTSFDGLIQLFLKFDGEYDPSFPKEEEKYYTYDCYFELDTGKSEAGHVKIFSYGNANYKIDNLSIKNLDYQGVRQSLDKDSIGFKSNRHEKTPDYVYEDKSDNSDLLEEQIKNRGQEKKRGCNSSLVITSSCILIPLGVVALLIRRNKS